SDAAGRRDLRGRRQPYDARFDTVVEEQVVAGSESAELAPQHRALCVLRQTAIGVAPIVDAHRLVKRVERRRSERLEDDDRLGRPPRRVGHAQNLALAKRRDRVYLQLKKAVSRGAVIETIAD